MKSHKKNKFFTLSSMKFANNIFRLVATQWIFFVSAVQLNRIHRRKTSVATTNVGSGKREIAQLDGIERQRDCIY